MKELLALLKARFGRGMDDNRGVGVIEVVLILVIVIAIVLIFKNQIMGIINSAFGAISRDSNSIIN